ncbi:endonuclease dU [Halorubrum vacuolatum]|uniref:Uncharacterized protein n=1 Tax=Halorubrum vacuolatum TaxID=63740 RepID=A0A238VPE7_HALVU|nr:DUF99 family protein [Halorubrum vacuolatum]SNR36230.1 hypothetical protein SAMN06264855_103240 [Halorubrum vacuolatum]
MRPGSRTLGVAFSDGERRSRLAGAVVRANGTLDGLAFETCTVGGTDATDAVIRCFESLDREDIRRICCAGVAPAWFNLLDLHRIHEATGRPVFAVSYEESPGLEPALRAAFDGSALAERLAVYRRLPPRRRVEPGGDRDGSVPIFVRSVGATREGSATNGDDPEATIRALVREGFRRPEPVRIAKIAAGAHRSAVER